MVAAADPAQRVASTAIARAAGCELRSAAGHIGLRQARRALAVLLQAQAPHRSRLLHLRGRRDQRARLQSRAGALRRQRRLRESRQAVDVMSESQQFDAIVVGSGITGGWAAKELTEKGLKVLVLERWQAGRASHRLHHRAHAAVADAGSRLFEREEYERDYADPEPRYAASATRRGTSGSTTARTRTCSRPACRSTGCARMWSAGARWCGAGTSIASAISISRRTRRTGTASTGRSAIATSRRGTRTSRSSSA